MFMTILLMRRIARFVKCLRYRLSHRLNSPWTISHERKAIYYYPQLENYPSLLYLRTLTGARHIDRSKKNCFCRIKVMAVPVNNNNIHLR